MSWIPTIRVARAAWKGRQDPAGLIKAQLSTEEPVAAAAPAGAPAPAALAPPVVATQGEPEPPQEDPTHAQLLLLLR